LVGVGGGGFTVIAIVPAVLVETPSFTVNVKLSAPKLELVGV
jgi:hypothetical protein